MEVHENPFAVLSGEKGEVNVTKMADAIVVKSAAAMKEKRRQEEHQKRIAESEKQNALLSSGMTGAKPLVLPDYVKNSQLVFREKNTEQYDYGIKAEAAVDGNQESRERTGVQVHQQDTNVATLSGKTDKKQESDKIPTPSYKSYVEELLAKEALKSKKKKDVKGQKSEKAKLKKKERKKKIIMLKKKERDSLEDQHEEEEDSSSFSEEDFFDDSSSSSSSSLEGGELFEDEEEVNKSSGVGRRILSAVVKVTVLITIGFVVFSGARERPARWEEATVLANANYFAF